MLLNKVEFKIALLARLDRRLNNNCFRFSFFFSLNLEICPTVETVPPSPIFCILALKNFFSVKIKGFQIWQSRADSSNIAYSSNSNLQPGASHRENRIRVPLCSTEH